MLTSRQQPIWQMDLNFIPKILKLIRTDRWRCNKCSRSRNIHHTNSISPFPPPIESETAKFTRKSILIYNERRWLAAIIRTSSLIIRILRCRYIVCTLGSHIHSMTAHNLTDSSIFPDRIINCIFCVFILQDLRQLSTHYYIHSNSWPK